jgi:autotransporter-associated beta strand protein
VYLDNTNTALSRVGAIPVALNGSNLTVTGNLTTPLAQDFGALTATGAVTITANIATPSSTQTRQAVTVRFTNLIRNDHATLLFYGGTDSSGSTSPAVGEGKAVITLGSGLTSALVGANTTATNHPVLPFAYAHPTAGNNLVTYDPVNGIRGLRADEFSTALTAGDNVWLTTSQVNNADLSINSLKTDGYITGTGTLSVASGLVLSSSNSPSIQNNLSFGAAEAVFLTASALNVSGQISGTGGLTKGAAGSLNLTGANTFTGPITVNEGMLNFKDMGSLGADTSEIVLNDGASLVPNTANVTLTRGLRLNGYYQASISGPSTAGNFVIGAPITGTGQLLVSFSNVVFTAANTFAGDLTVGGTLTFGGDAMLGGGTRVALNSGGKLVLAAPWTTSRTLAVNGSSFSTVDTAGFDASIAKLTSQFSSSSLVKAGAGLLTLPDAGGFFGAMSVTAGEVRLDGTIPDNATGTLSVSAGATLSGSMQGTRTVLVFGTLSPGDGVGPMSSGNLLFQGNSTLSMELASSTGYDQVNVTGSVTLTGTVQLALNLGVTNLADTFTLILNDGTDAVSGRFTYAGTTLNEGTQFQAGGQAFQISYVGGTGNDVVLTAVPEPANAGLLLLGALALAARRRRRSREASA